MPPARAGNSDALREQEVGIVPVVTNRKAVSCSEHAGEAWTGPSRTPWWPLSCLSP